MKKKLLVMFEIMLFTGVIASGYFIRSENLKFGIRIFHFSSDVWDLL